MPYFLIITPMRGAFANKADCCWVQIKPVSDSAAETVTEDSKSTDRQE